MVVLSDREQFLAQVYGQRATGGDVIVVLCGEDYAARLEYAETLFKHTQWAPLLCLTGGRDDGMRCWGALRSYGHLLGKGIAPDRMVTESRATNTYEQAMYVVEMAEERKWGRVLLLASHYHLPRAYLTFVMSLLDHDLDKIVRLIPVPVASAWHDEPEGVGMTRELLLEVEAGKIETYGNDVATYRQGLDYLKYWESH